MPGCRLLPNTIAVGKAQRPGHHGNLLRAGAYLVYALFFPNPALKVCLSLVKCRIAKICTSLKDSKVFISLPVAQPAAFIAVGGSMDTNLTCCVRQIFAAFQCCQLQVVILWLQEVEMENLLESSQSSLQNSHTIFQEAG